MRRDDDRWQELARAAAARQWGARHYRWYAAARSVRWVGPLLAAVVVVAAAVGAVAFGGLWVKAHAHELAVLLLWAAVGAGASGLLLLVSQALTGAGVRRAAAGRRSVGVVGWLMVCAVALAVAAAWTGR